jgi:hypothetical protein
MGHPAHDEENFPQRLKPNTFNFAYLARLKSCPFKTGLNYNLYLLPGGGPGHAVGFFAGVDHFGHLPCCKIDYGYLMAAEAGDVRDLAVGADEDFLGLRSNLDGPDGFHGGQIDDF